jgi:F-type H+-transporting ATPase subunit delta
MSESRDINAEDARAAAELDADVGVEHIAAVYATALLDAADQAGQMEDAIAELDALTAEVLDRFPNFDAVLASAMISSEEKAGILDRAFAGRLSPLAVHFLKVVARHGRLDCLRAIRRQAHALYDKRKNRVPVELTSAEPIDAEMAERIKRDLREKLGAEPLLNVRVDPELIGGAVLRVGDVVYDGSIANQLENLREQMLQRSAHEIQSRRNRFRDSAGD